MAVYQLGRFGRCYVKEEATYRTQPALVATDAVRHLGVDFAFDPHNRINSPERFRHPSILRRFNRRNSADWTMRGMLWPSDLLNTVPELDPVLEHSFGTKANVTLSTTLTGTPTTTTGTVADATGLAAGQFVLITVGGSKFARLLTNVTGSDLTWAPALASAPVATDPVKGGLTYQLATTISKSLYVTHYLPDWKRGLLGAVCNELALTFDANNEPMFEVSGPASEQEPEGSVPAEPGAFTTTGAAIPSGLSGYLRVDGTAYDFLKAEVRINNNMAVQHENYGYTAAQAFYRRIQREVTFNVDARVSDDSTLYDKALAAADSVLLLQTGFTEGSIIAVYAGQVDFKLPSTPDDDAENTWSFSGFARGATGNDEIYLGFL